MAYLGEANLIGANLFGADLSGAILIGANLNEAHLREANLSMASLYKADLSGTDLFRADLSRVRFEPREMPKAAGLQDVRGLDSLRFWGAATYGLTALRNIFKEAGMRQEERQVNYALQYNRRVNTWDEIEKQEKDGNISWFSREMAAMENIFQLVMFEWTCQWGMEPGRPLQIMFLGLFVFTIPYLLALRSRDPETGLWVLLLPDRVLDRELKGRPFKMSTRRPFRPLPKDATRFGEVILRGWRLVRLAFYFSLLAAFQLGWRELNVGNWLARLQRKE